MKVIKIIVLILLFTSGISLVSAQDSFLLKSSTASVQGTSSLHDWE